VGESNHNGGFVVSLRITDQIGAHPKGPLRTIVFNGYFNFSNSIADGYWQRHTFLRSWWRIYANDQRWVPPHFPTLYRYLVRDPGPHLARMRPALIRMEALPDTHRRSNDGLPRATGALWETTVGAAVLLMDPRRQDRTAYLGLLRCVNDTEALKRFLFLALETAAKSGYQRLVGPTGLSAHLDSGVLENYFHVPPPLHTPYNPPYVPEVMRGALYPMRTRALFHVSTEVVEIDEDRTVATGIRVVPMANAGWRSILVPLLCAVYDEGGRTARPTGATLDLPAPDVAEAEFLLDWISAWPLRVWTAILDEEPVGFIMLQPDLSRPVAWAGGGRNHLRRAWLAWRSSRPAKSGRLLFFGVVPEHRTKGIGDALWHRALVEARNAGWESITVGPLPLSHPLAAFIRSRGGEVRQTYRLYTTEL
jgi:GNAT superfamily N-acetyltransferase